MEYSDNRFDKAYAIEATCHSSDLTKVYSEIYRVLKPGGLFVCCEWIMTDKYDKNDAYHRKLKADILVSQTTSLLYYTTFVYNIKLHLFTTLHYTVYFIILHHFTTLNNVCLLHYTTFVYYITLCCLLHYTSLMLHYIDVPHQTTFVYYITPHWVTTLHYIVLAD